MIRPSLIWCVKRYHHTHCCLARNVSGKLQTNPLIVPVPVSSIGTRNFSSYFEVLSKSTPVLELQKVLVSVHEYAGLPWWAAILLTTLSIRSIVTFPLAVHQYQVSARLKNIHAELAKLAPELNKEVTIASRKYNWDYRTTKLVYKQNIKRFYNKFIIRDNCHPFKTALLVLVQVPLWICFSAALRNLSFMMPYRDSAAEEIFMQLKSGGALWFSDLTVADHICIPVLIGLINLALIEVHNLRNPSSGSLLSRILKNSARGFTLVVCAASSVCPSCMSFYWLCSSMFGFGQAILLMMPKVRRVLRIPSCDKDSATPFKDIHKILKTKLSSS